MNLKALTFLLIGICAITQCLAQESQGYIFFLHNRFLEEHSLNEEHPEYGRTEYLEIIQAFEDKNFTVISEIRKGNVNAREYAFNVKDQIDSLLSMGVAPDHITVIGTSKGGYIAQYVSTLCAMPELNFVFVASFTERDIEQIPEINFCGNILTIYERTDEYGVSAIRRKESSSLKINRFKEIELHTGLRHGFLFRAMDEWINPSVQWAKRNYSF